MGECCVTIGVTAGNRRLMVSSCVRTTVYTIRERLLHTRMQPQLVPTYISSSITSRELTCARGAVIESKHEIISIINTNNNYCNTAIIPITMIIITVNIIIIINIRGIMTFIATILESSSCIYCTLYYNSFSKPLLSNSI